MNSLKATRITFWITTTIIFLFEGVMPALTGHTELAKEGIRHLGYPSYFGPMLGFFKVLGTLALILPFVPARIKEWAYFGLGISMICACISHIAVDGFSVLAFFPLLIFSILATSYVCYHRLQVRTNLSFA